MGATVQLESWVVSRDQLVTNVLTLTQIHESQEHYFFNSSLPSNGLVVMSVGVSRFVRWMFFWMA